MSIVMTDPFHDLNGMVNLIMRRYRFVRLLRRRIHVAMWLMVGVPPRQLSISGLEPCAHILGFEMTIRKGAICAAMMSEETGLSLGRQLISFVVAG